MSKHTRFSNQVVQNAPKIKGTTKRCNVVEQCGQGFRCNDDGYCVMQGQTMPPPSDAKLAERLLRKLIKMVRSDDLTKRQASSIVQATNRTFVPDLVRQVVQGRISIDEYRQSVRKEQQRLYRRNIFQQQQVIASL